MVENRLSIGYTIIIFPRLYAYSLKCSKRVEVAEEIVQETFVQLWLSRATIRETDKLDRLLIVIAHHKLLNAIRRTATAAGFCRLCRLRERNLYVVFRRGGR